MGMSVKDERVVQVLDLLLDDLIGIRKVTLGGQAIALLDQRRLSHLWRSGALESRSRGGRRLQLLVSLLLLLLLADGIADGFTLFDQRARYLLFGLLRVAYHALQVRTRKHLLLDRDGHALCRLLAVAECLNLLEGIDLEELRLVLDHIGVELRLGRGGVLLRLLLRIFFQLIGLLLLYCLLRFKSTISTSPSPLSFLSALILGTVLLLAALT